MKIKIKFSFTATITHFWTSIALNQKTFIDKNVLSTERVLLKYKTTLNFLFLFPLVLSHISSYFFNLVWIFFDIENISTCHTEHFK